MLRRIVLAALMMLPLFAAVNTAQATIPFPHCYPCSQ